jgi:kumamolisin
MPRRSSSTVSPLAVAKHYSFPDTTGKGQRIALLEMGGGFHQDDLARQCRQQGVPLPRLKVHALRNVRSEGNPPLSAGNAPLDPATLRTIIAAFAKPRASLAKIQQQYGEDGTFERFMETMEATLDVQLVATLAPGARLDVYFFPKIAEGVVAAIDAAVAGKADIISLSVGTSESDWGPGAVALIDAALERAAKRGITICCSSGDYGSRNRPPGVNTKDRKARVNYPASSPWALSCGGTSLVQKRGDFTGETAWNSTVFGMQRATGGGVSGWFPRPSYQRSLKGPAGQKGIWVRKPSKQWRGRLVPDVAAHADRALGYAIVLGGKPFAADGTSAAAPLWAALLARVAEAIGRPVGWFNKSLPAAAAAGAFHDVTEGNNAVDDVARSFSAGPGWDPCTGYGSPNGERLVAALSARGRTRAR